MHGLQRADGTGLPDERPRNRNASDFGLAGLSLLTVAPPLDWLDLSPIGRDKIRVRTVAPAGFDGCARLLSPFYRSGFPGSPWCAQFQSTETAVEQGMPETRSNPVVADVMNIWRWEALAVIASTMSVSRCSSAR